MKLTPSQKQALSGFAVGVTGAALASLEQALTHPPFTLRSLGIAALAGAIAGVAHYLPTFGTAEKVSAQVAARVAAAGKEAS